MLIIEGQLHVLAGWPGRDGDSNEIEQRINDSIWESLIV